MPLKKLTDNNYVHAALVSAYFRGWDDHAKGRTPINEDTIEIVSNFFFGKVSRKEVVVVNSDGPFDCHPIVPNTINTFWPSHGAMVKKAYSAGQEEAALFDSGKAHGAIDLPREQWVSLLSDEEARTQYVLGKAREFVDRKYFPEELHFNASAIEILTNSCLSIWGVYHGTLEKGDVVQNGPQYIRISNVNGNKATGEILGTFDKAKVTSLHRNSEQADVKQDDEAYLVEGASAPDHALEGFVPTVDSELKRILKKRKNKHKAKVRQAADGVLKVLKGK